jgi:hypothetical protein
MPTSGVGTFFSVPEGPKRAQFWPRPISGSDNRPLVNIELGCSQLAPTRILWLGTGPVMAKLQPATAMVNSHFLNIWDRTRTKNQTKAGISGCSSPSGVK